MRHFPNDTMAIGQRNICRKLRIKYGTRFVYLNIDRLLKHYLVDLFYNPEPIF